MEFLAAPAWTEAVFSPSQAVRAIIRSFAGQVKSRFASGLGDTMPDPVFGADERKALA
jgi:hypothetical protein